MLSLGKASVALDRLHEAERLCAPEGADETFGEFPKVLDGERQASRAGFEGAIGVPPPRADVDSEGVKSIEGYVDDLAAVPRPLGNDEREPRGCGFRGVLPSGRRAFVLRVHVFSSRPAGRRHFVAL